jgi:hypothetical protein
MYIPISYWQTQNEIYNIGDLAEGGVIVYILQPGDSGYSNREQHGLVAAISDLPDPFYKWGCYGTVIAGADGTAIGTGNQNTIDIMAGCGTPGIAARACGDLVQGGYSDWYLPSIDELQQLYNNRAIIPGISNYFYWSSSETPNTSFFAKRIWFEDGSMSPGANKDIPFFVRPIRSF